MSTKLGTKHSWVKVFQLFKNKGSRPFPRGGGGGNNYEIAKKKKRNLKIFLSEIPWSISSKHSPNHYLVKCSQVCSSEGPHLFPRGDNYEISYTLT